MRYLIRRRIDEPVQADAERCADTNASKSALI
jgi:hypothetical protein